MDEEIFHNSIRKLLKSAGVGAQREIEEAVAKALASGALDDGASFPATMTLKVPALNLETSFDADIQLG